MKPLVSNLKYRILRRRRGFTIIEIALCLAIIGQDAEVWMNAIRTGAQGYDDLTNYVLCITNFWTKFKPDGTVGGFGNDWYTPSGSGVTSIIPPPDCPLTNG